MIDLRHLHKDLQKNTPYSHKDKAPLDAALYKITQVANWINEEKRTAENTEKIIDVHFLLYNLTHPFRSRVA